MPHRKIEGKLLSKTSYLRRYLIIFGAGVFALLNLLRASSGTRLRISSFGTRNPVYDFDQVYRFTSQVVRNCPAAFHRVQGKESSRAADPLHLFLQQVDGLYVLTSSNSCQNRFGDLGFTCVKGKVLDSCVPKRYHRLIDNHGYAVSFSHAAIFAQAMNFGYENVAIIEDDASIELKRFNRGLILSLNKLLRSNKWNIIRLGYRPYFFEAKERESTYKCPSQCRCTGRHGLDTGLCKLAGAGCDLRSADFYIAHKRVFANLLSMLLDVDTKDRVIDFFTLQQIEDTWLVVPQVSFQEKLESVFPVSLQLGFSELFYDACCETWKHAASRLEFDEQHRIS